MENIIFKKCKENIEMYSTANQIFKEKYLLALNNIEENFSNYPSLEDLLKLFPIRGMLKSPFIYAYFLMI